MDSAPHTNPPHRPLVIGTRGSPLALAQARLTQAALEAAHPELAASRGIEIKAIRTTGDVIRDRPLAEIGGKGLFTKEIEEALFDGRIDLAVHSMKDVPTTLPDGLAIAAVLPREDPRDAFFARDAASFADLKPGAVVGTASLRRQAQVLALRPDLQVVPFRGNVQTRLAKLAAGDVDATLLAMAGLKRLGMEDEATAAIPESEMLPAVAQGAIGIEIRAEDSETHALLEPLNCPESAARIEAERAALAWLEGNCRTPIAAFAEIEGDRMRLRSMIALPSGAEAHYDDREGPAAQATMLGQQAGAALLALAGPDFLRR